MKITICGSIAFFDEMVEAKNKLESFGHAVIIPPTEVEDENGQLIPVKQYYEIRKKETGNDGWVWDKKGELIREYFEEIENSDAVLVVNQDKNDIEGYVGANSFLEMGLAFYLKKKIFLLKKVPEMPCKEEILGMKPIVIDEDLSRIN